MSELSRRVTERWLKKASGMSPEVLKWIVARSQKKKGIVQIPIVERAFEHLPGWSITSTTAFLSLNSMDGDDIIKVKMPTWMSKWDVRLSGGSSSNSPFSFGEVITQQGMDEFRDLVTIVPEKVKVPPGQAQVGKIYSTPPGKMPSKYGWEPQNGASRMWLGVPGWIISAPGGKSAILPSPVNRKGVPHDSERLENLPSFWTFLYKEKIDQTALKVLENYKEEAEEISAPAAERKRIQQKRILLPEVEKLLRKIVDSQFQNVWDRITDQHLGMLSHFLAYQENKWEEEKDKPWPQFSTWQFYKNIGHFADFLQKATEKDIRGSGLDNGWRKRRGQYLDIARATAKQITESLREDFVHKNGEKLSLIIRQKGNLAESSLVRIDSGSNFEGDIVFKFEDGSQFLVKNKSIYNVSSLGKVFLQFPTTFHNVVLPNGKPMTGVSEKTMVEVFALA